MPRVHKKFYCMADPRPLKRQAFKQPHSSCGLDTYNVIDPKSEASTNSSMNSHSPRKQPCRMTSGSAETDLFLHSKILTRNQWILHLRPCSKVCFVLYSSFFSQWWHRRSQCCCLFSILKLIEQILRLTCDILHIESRIVDGQSSKSMQHPFCQSTYIHTYRSPSV